MSSQISSNIIEAIADSNGVKPRNLDIVLYDHIDLEAVEQLHENSSSTWKLEFELPKNSVTVNSDGDIHIDGQLENDWKSA